MAFAEDIHKHKPRDIKPQGAGSGLDADKVDGLHASEIGGGTDEKVKVSANDTTTRFLLEKLVAGLGITLTEQNDGDDETLKICAHRKWGWADEPTWDKKYYLPYPPYTKNASNPILSPGAPGEWDDHHVWPGCILYENGEFWLYYAGHNGSTWAIGLATSSDGVNFTNYAGNPILTVGADGSWDDYHVSCPTVIKAGDGDWLMYYEGYEDATRTRIGYATSTDGKSWSKSGSNPVMDVGAGGTWDDDNVRNPSAVLFGKMVVLFYAGYDGAVWKLGVAISYDRTSFTKYPNAVIDAAPDAHIVHVTLYWDQGVFYVGFTAVPSSGPRTLKMALGGRMESLTKWWDNPILEVGTGWESSLVEKPCWLRIGTKYYLYYSGYDGSTYKIGLATIP